MPKVKDDEVTAFHEGERLSPPVSDFQVDAEYSCGDDELVGLANDSQVSANADIRLIPPEWRVCPRLCPSSEPKTDSVHDSLWESLRRRND